MRLKIRTYSIERVAYSGVEFYWMESVQKQQVRNERIAAKLVNDCPPRISGIGCDFHHPIQPGGMELHHGLKQFGHRRARFRVRQSVNARGQLFDCPKGVVE